MTHSGRSATEILLCYFNKITGSEGCIVPPPVYSSKSEDLFALLRVLFSYMPVCVCARGVGCRLLTLQAVLCVCRVFVLNILYRRGPSSEIVNVFTVVSHLCL